MKYPLYILYILILIASSCKKETPQQNVTVKKTGMDGSVKHLKYTPLHKYAAKNIENWKEYMLVEKFLQQFKNTTPTTALNNAIELKELTKQLKDSLKIKTLQKPAFKARINVFENEVLRLADMTYIPAITSKDINSQVGKIRLLFGSMNTKINTIYTKQQFDKEINLDSLFNFKER
ncbi:hypothetical protein LNI90_02165 [Tenacibaculum dicentrarchi]|uniref:Lipoprotein n=1 Tax=Tenacibaculum dicentrarchi TaxID=669041 RepID=A0ABP1EMS3_9FLAO|nr:hypothetical protein [Tenacibaculum dicentrarchi]MCD8406730.1 hypothetical protein [Tenacibaculum dicentrarchi]MCD8414288.1 hypothetical protein [Tenacibaculum dicentrarchi]MCD8419074.1 hypothetical protein [Tenacibaculum dicentrarchi]MCD8424085.1 hypothetical protein [Tenacibaculum dicentrarchi]